MSTAAQSSPDQGRKWQVKHSLRMRTKSLREVAGRTRQNDRRSYFAAKIPCNVEATFLRSLLRPSLCRLVTRFARFAARIDSVCFVGEPINIPLS